MSLDKNGMFSSNFPQENGQSGHSSSNVTLTDEAGRSLNCSIEHSLNVEGIDYLLLLPLDSPVEIVAWDEDDQADDLADATLVEDETEIDEIFSDAQAVLAEQNLILKRTAFTLTVAGELPPADQEEILSIELAEEEVELEPEQLQLLANFYHEEQEYGIYTPLDPLLFFAKRNPNGQLELLSPEEFQKVQPLLEELLFEDLD